MVVILKLLFIEVCFIPKLLPQAYLRKTKKNKHPQQREVDSRIVRVTLPTRNHIPNAQPMKGILLNVRIRGVEPIFNILLWLGLCLELDLG